MPINSRVKHHYFGLYFGVFLFLISGCSAIKNSRYDEFLSQKYEVPECATAYTYASSTSLMGTAEFYKRGVNLVLQGSNLKNMTLGDPLATPLPIRYAEVAVYNSDNQIVQCGVTNDEGKLKALDGTSNLTIPATAGTYTVRVYARMNHTLEGTGGKPDFKVHVAVKQDKYTNELHSIAAQVSSNGVDDSAVTLTAYARQTDSLGVEGGAFNILNAVFTAYDYIRTDTGTVDTTCLNGKFNVYWKLGFNPAQYVYPDLDPAGLSNGSFYDQSIQSLFITGGRLGNITLDVTNHFDDYVIIHETGHHIEDVCGTLHTPGGSHQIITRIDPRLAWAEGWANFFAAQVMHNRLSELNPEFPSKMAAAGISDTSWTYLFASEGFSDSVQNIGNGGGFMFDLKKPGNNPDTWQSGVYYGQPFDKVDPTRYFGEGHFREGAITRGLFKLTTDCGANCIPSGDEISFENMWKSMDKITGIGQPYYFYKSSEDFMERLKVNVTSGVWNSTYRAFNAQATSEALHLWSDGYYNSGAVFRWMPYGLPLSVVTSSACARTLYIEPRPDDPVLTGTNSDQRYSNHYYTIDFSLLPNLTQLNVNFTKITSGGTNTEFDLLLYDGSDYFAVDDYSCTTALDPYGTCLTSYQPSRGTNQYVVRSDRRSGTLPTKTIRDLNLLDQTKKYLLNIRAYTANRSINTLTDYEYKITDQNGDNVCP